MELEERIKAIEDKLALKQVVDSYAMLADEKNGSALANLFTPTAVVKIVIAGDLKATLNGTKEISDTFQQFLNSLDTAYYFNGQQVVKIKGDHAIGRSYTQATITSVQNGMKRSAVQNIYYDDEFVKVDGRWLIAKRTRYRQ